MHLDNLNINREMAEASNAARTLETALKAAFNVNTGQLDMTKFSQQLKVAGTDITTLGN